MLYNSRIYFFSFIFFILTSLNSFSFERNKPSFVIRTATSMEKIFRDSFKDRWLKKSVNDEIEISMCKNERESFQAVIIPFKEIRNMKWEITGKRRLKGISVNICPVGYVYISKNTSRRFANYPEKEIRTGWWPDPLFTFNRIEKIEAEKLQSIWITIDTSDNIPSGKYVFRILFQGENTNKAEVKVKLKIWNFSLPDETTLKTSFWYATSDFSSYYFLKDTWPVEKKFLKMALDNRITPVNGEFIHYIGISYNHENGKYTFDFSNLKRYLQFIFNESKRKGNVFNIANIGFARGFSRWGVKGVKGRLDLKPFTKKYEDFLIQYFTSMKNFLKENGWYEKAYVGFVDEPGPDVWENIKWIYKITKKTVPELPTVSAVNYQPSVKALKDYIDIVIPGFFSNFNPANLPDFFELQKEGKQLWGYICGKSSCIDYQPIDHRIWTWICWKYNLKGFLYWGIVNWDAGMWQARYKKEKEQLLHKNIEERWPYKAKWETVLSTGDGYLMYPSPEGNPWSSIRLENIRDGIEDYEYFSILSRNLEKIKKMGRRYRKTVKKGEELLSIKEIVKSPDMYTRNREKIMEKRKELGDMIEKTTAIINRGNK